MVPVMGKAQVGLAAVAAVFAACEVVSLWFGAFVAVEAFAGLFFLALAASVAVGIWRLRREDGE